MKENVDSIQKQSSLKQFFKKHFKANPLSYLGWLGILGMFGIIFIPVFIPFLLCFTFFSYRNMVPDELFWQNVSRASTRAFWSVFALDTIIAVWMFIRGMVFSFGGNSTYIETVIQGDVVSMGVFAFDQNMITFLAFFVSIILMNLVFTISMMRFQKREKRMLEEA